MKDLSRKVMLVNLTISAWDARSFDQKATMEVVKNHHAKETIGRFNKNLLPENARSYKLVRAKTNELRGFHYAHTMEYDQLGVRLLPADMYLDYSAGIRQYEREIKSLVEVFLADLPDLKEQARNELNGLFRESDYPTAAQLRQKFGLKLNVLPFPDAAQFSIALPEPDLVSIRQDIEEQTQEAVAKAMRELWERLYDVVSKMAERLSTPDAIFRDTLVENVRDICGLLPQLNFTGDQTLEGLRAQVQQKLAAHNPDMLRNSPLARADTAKKAIEIQQAMAAYMGIPTFQPNPQEDSQLSLLAA